MTEPIKLSAFVVPELGKQRIDAQWSRINERRPLLERRTGRLIPAAGVLALVAALAFLAWPRDTHLSVPSAWEGSVVASDDAPVDMTLSEGTHIKVEPRSEVKLLHSAAHAVEVRLARGSARFEVAKKPARRFSVHAGRVEVVVTGTQFRVQRRELANAERVWVEVDEGSVEVHRSGGGVVYLRAGERWSTVVDEREQAPKAAPAKSAANALIADADPAFEGDILGSLNDLGEAALGFTDATESNETNSSEGVDDAEEEGLDEEENERPARKRGRVTARDLFDHANLARRAGRLDEAATLYGRLVAQHPSDRRAPLAAFELGRLQMDSLRNTRGAVRALERALKLAPDGTFAEDALARLVLAQEALHDGAGCTRARERYLSRYPEGVHAQHVAERCRAK